MNELRDIPVALLIESQFPLRPVRRNTVEYRELVDSVRKEGILQPLLVRPHGANFEVVEGGHRRCAALECGLETVPCLVRDISDDEVLFIQVQANAIRPTTQKAEFAARLHQLMQARGLTLPQLAAIVNKSTSWLRDMLLLNKLTPAGKNMVNRGEISVKAACALARVPMAMQPKLHDDAVLLSTEDFVEKCRTVLKNFRELVKQGRTEMNILRQYEPMPWLRQLKEIRHEALTSEQAGVILDMMDASTALEGWRACLAWILHLDPISIKRQLDKMERVRHEKMTHADRLIADRLLRDTLLKESTHEQRTDNLQSPESPERLQ